MLTVKWFTLKFNLMQLRTVGIDFSINSPAFCCYNNGKYTWGSITRSDRDKASYMKSTKKPFFVLSNNEDFVLHFMYRTDLPTDYTKKERAKMLYYSEIVDLLWSSILEIMGEGEFSVAMEGLSFSSNGNSLIDISMATALLRDKMIKHIGVNNFYVFSPTSIKKFAGKGTLKKDELYSQLSRIKDETNLENFSTILESNKSEWITPAKAVNKPIDDLVDSTWINLYLIKELREFYGIKSNLEIPTIASLESKSI